jgi:hypothetical protein
MWRANTSSPMLLLNKGNQRLSLRENERAIMKGETQGFVKLLVDTKGKILGGHILASSSLSERRRCRAPVSNGRLYA